MSSKFHCWSLDWERRTSACSWYRVHVPMEELRKQGFAEVYRDDQQGDPALANIALLHSDIGHFYSLAGEEVLHRLRSLKRVKPGHRKLEGGEGVDLFPPALIWDTDDNADFVHPFNQTFITMGIRSYPDGRLLEPGDGLEILLEGSTREIVDGVTHRDGIKFDIARNLHDMKVRHQIMREVHGVTVASPMLAKYCREVIGCENVYVFPNSISPRHYDPIRAVRTDQRVRVLWQGGMSHLVDWYPLRDALRAVCQKYEGRMTFVVFGEYFDWINEVVPPGMLEHHSWVEYPAYRLKRGLLNCDVNLCPLVNNVFNSGKSAIKWYEASIFEDQPEATLAQRVAAYGEIEDGETGLLFDTPAQFAEKLGLLIEDAELRRRLARAAHRWVVENRTPEKTVPGLADFYMETRARQRRELGKPVIKPATMEQIQKLTVPLTR